MSSKKVSTKQKVKNGILGFVSGATSGGATGAVVAVGGCFVAGCALVALGPIAAGAGAGAIASQAITGGVALTTMYGAPAAVGAGALSAGAGGIGGAIKGSKCKSKKEALLKSAKIGAGCGAVIGGASIIAVGAVAAASAGGIPRGGVRYERDNDDDIIPKNVKIKRGNLKNVKLKDAKLEDIKRKGIKVEGIKIGSVKIKNSDNDTRYMKLVKHLKSKSISKEDLESILDGKYQIEALKQASANKTASFIYSDVARSLIKEAVVYHGMSIALRKFEHRPDLEGFTGLMAAVFANKSKSFERQEIENAFKDDVLKQNRKILNELMETKEFIEHIDRDKIKESIELSTRYWNLLKESKSVIQGKKDQVNELLPVFHKYLQILKEGDALKPGEKLSNNQVKFMSYVSEEIKEWFEDNPEITQINKKWTILHHELSTIQSFWELTQTKIKEVIEKSGEKTKEKLKETLSKVKKTYGIFGSLVAGAAAVVALVASPIAVAVAADAGATKETKRIVDQFKTMSTDAARLDALFSDLVDNLKTPKKPAKQINKFSDFDDEEPNYDILAVNAGIVIDSLKEIQITCEHILNAIAEAKGMSHSGCSSATCR